MAKNTECVRDDMRWDGLETWIKPSILHTNPHICPEATDTHGDTSAPSAGSLTATHSGNLLPNFLKAKAYNRARLEWSLEALGYSSLSEFGALPLPGVWLSVSGAVIAPIGNAMSRKHEREADAYAVERTGKRDALVSALNRLAAMNISDIEPYSHVEWLFYSHPSISKRVRAIESMAPR